MRAILLGGGPAPIVSLLGTGWAEVTIVIRFWIITGPCVAAGLGLFHAEWVGGY